MGWVESTAGKDYTTLDAIQDMRRSCRVEAKGRDCGSNRPERENGAEYSSTPSGSFGTAQLGVPPHEICGFFGITLEVFERVYGHHHPDYQSNAVNAFSRPRQKSDRYNETKREQAGTNVVKLHRKH
jgi:hypothetical protein